MGLEISSSSQQGVAPQIGLVRICHESARQSGVNSDAPKVSPQIDTENRRQSDQEILASARRHLIESQPQVRCDYYEMEDFQFSARTQPDAEMDHLQCLFILQDEEFKMTVEVSPETKPVLQCFEHGRPVRLTGPSVTAFHRYLVKRNFIGLAGFSVKYVPKIREEKIAGYDFGWQHEEEILSAYSSFTATPAKQAVPEQESALTVQVISPAQTNNVPMPGLKGNIAFVIPPISAEEGSCMPAEMGLNISQCFMRLARADSVSEIEEHCALLYEYDSRYPGVLAGKAIPDVHQACFAAFENILGKSSLFIDELNEDVLELGKHAGLPEDQVKTAMVRKALDAFMKEMSTDSGTTLKLSRARKMDEFLALMDKKSPQGIAATEAAFKLAEGILKAEVYKQTHKQSCDQELIRLYSDLVDWLES